ncbi:WD40 repeat domain-containing serine/threonine protein kinase [Nocardia acidivorans]|uniref:WD40 repeat domain-containing serine/threonine protein kinase n=1 Tax=Nocardia acidivorans TaxID=404580 RepID=UPI0008305125|nr:serine/threonine-protein kinase [Nocardia acidivorans]
MALEPGSVFAGYTVLELAGSGGMGAVYRMRHPRLRTDVAVKVLSTHVGVDAKVRARFEREARLTAALQHPNIVRVHDCGTEGETPWIAMDFVAGSDAERLVRTGPLPVYQAVEIVRQAAAALDYAHDKGVLHRDVKPANLLVSEHAGQPHVQITDFGIARGLGEPVTTSGSVRATFAYAAPEQFGGGAVDHRADVYALGCTLFHLLCGALPFPLHTVYAIVNAHLFSPPPLITEVCPGMPEGLDQVIATALAKAPGDRYGSCGALAAAAFAALREPVRSAPTIVVPPQSDPAQRPVTGLDQLTPAPVAPPPGRLAVDLIGHIGRVRALAFDPWGSRIATGGDDQTVRIWDARSGKQIGDPLAQNLAVHAVAFSPDGSLLASAGGRNARLWHAETGRRLCDDVYTAVPSIPAFSPDAAVLATSNSQSVLLWDTHRRNAFGKLEMHAGFGLGCSSVAFSPDATLVATARRDEVILRDYHSGDSRRGSPFGATRDTLEHPREQVRRVLFTPDGRTLLTVSDRAARLWVYADNRYRVELLLPMEPVGIDAEAAFSADGSRFAVAHQDWVVLWSRHTGQSIRFPLAADAGPVRSVAFSADGALLIVTTATALRLWDVEARAQLGADAVPPVVFAPDGRTFAAAQHDRVCLRDIAELR